MNAAQVNTKDIQGLVRFGYAALTEACFFLLNIRDVASARSWLSSAPISAAEELPVPPTTALQVAFTREGLAALEVSGELLRGFSAEFLSGMSGEESRSRRLGDVGASSPQTWLWGGPGNVPHMLVMFYAQPGKLSPWIQSLQTVHWIAAFGVLATLDTSDLKGKEPFGFNDGISQPTPDWKRERTAPTDELTYGNLVSLGEFLLGYPNEYGKYSYRPVLSPDASCSSVLAFAEDQPNKRDFGLNGTYLVLRQLEQDVRGFWRFLDGQTVPNALARQNLAEAMVGRRMDGTPLLPLRSAGVPGIDANSAKQNSFTYDLDREGTRCPFGAHIRRANPRNADLPASTGPVSRLLHTLGFGNPLYRDDVIASTRFHRMIRRGREYGPKLTPDQAISEQADTAERGINFICIVANILRQFEFVQNSWIVNTKFDGLTEESDPLLGNRQAIAGCPFTDTYSQPQPDDARNRTTGLPQFVTVRGGAYFFLPSLSAVRYLVAIGQK